MRSARTLRDELRFVTQFGSLLTVMQQVAVSQLRKTQDILGTLPRLSGVLARDYFRLLPDAARQEPFVRGGRAGQLLVVFGTDEGFTGPLQGNVVRTAAAQAGPATRWVLLGQRTLQLVERQTETVRALPVPSDEEADTTLTQLSQDILREFREAELRAAWLIAPWFRSATRHEVTAVPLLPLPVRWPTAGSRMAELITEPSVGEVVRHLAGCWVSRLLREAFWSARCVEYAARALQTEEALHAVAAQQRRLRYEQFKHAHERVDVMVRETCLVRRLGTGRR